MSGAPGAIEQFRLIAGMPLYQTFDDATPIEMRGPSILDAVAQLVLHGVVEPNGRIGGEHPRVRGGDRLKPGASSPLT